MGLTGLRMANRLPRPRPCANFRLGHGGDQLLLLGLGGAYPVRLVAAGHTAAELIWPVAVWSKTRAPAVRRYSAEQQHQRFNQLVELLYHAAPEH